MRPLLRNMSEASRKQLAEDLAAYGAEAQGLPHFELRKRFGLGEKRAERLYGWLRDRGLEDPLKAPEPPKNTEAGRPRKHLVFGDAHAEPHESLARFLWGGRMAADLLAPGDLVVHLGDWYDLASLCRHATALERSRERVTDEIAAGQEAVDLWHRGLGSAHGIEHVLTLGNHDDRLDRLAHDAPWLEGTFDVGSAHRARGWTVQPFLEPYRADGVCYQHYLTSPQSSRPVGGKYSGARVLEAVSYEESVVVGHSHLLHIAHRGARGGRQRWGISAGCFFEHVPRYAGRGAEQWFRGALLFHDVADGAFDLELFTMDRIRRRWGG